MRVLWRPLALAAAFIAIMMAGPASAQTVTVTKAPPGASVQLVLDTTAVATATADEKGIATLAVDLQKQSNKTETDVRIYVDLCGQARRITLVEAGYQPDQAAAGCTRHEIFGVFYLRQVTTLVVNVSDEAQGVWISQGPAPLRWLGNEVAGGSADRTGSALYVPNGFHIFGGGGIGRYSDAVQSSCGVNTECAGKGTRFAGQVGFDYWISSNVAVAAFYLRPANPATSGSGNGYGFTSSLATNIAVVTGKVGVPFGKTRLYVQGGITYTWATLTTDETFADRTVTVNGVPQTIPGGTQRFIEPTRGMSWTIGGGSEFWWRRSMAFYVEVGRVGLKGSAVGGGSGTLNDGVLYTMAGFRFRLVGSR
jgi:hypothetical protein